MIANFYELVLDSPEPEEWGGRHGTISTIVNSLRLTKNHRPKVKRVIKTAYEQMMNGQYYDGKHRHNGGKPAEIQRGSEEETMIADCKESGMSHLDTTVFLNEHRVEKNMPLIGVNAVKGAIKCMKKRLTPITKKSQGSNDPESDWCQARSRLRRRCW